MQYSTPDGAEYIAICLPGLLRPERFTAITHNFRHPCGQAFACESRVDLASGKHGCYFLAAELQIGPRDIGNHVPAAVHETDIGRLHQRAFTNTTSKTPACWLLLTCSPFFGAATLDSADMGTSGCRAKFPKT